MIEELKKNRHHRAHAHTHVHTHAPPQQQQHQEYKSDWKSDKRVGRNDKNNWDQDLLDIYLTAE